MRLFAFYVSVHETGKLQAALEAVRVLGDEARRYGIIVGILFNFRKYQKKAFALRLAKRMGIPVMIDSGGFQEMPNPSLYASWLCANRDNIDYAIGPDYPIIHCLRAGRDPGSCVEASMKLQREFRNVLRCDIRVVPVAHGYAPEVYAETAEALASLYDTDYVALGSLKAWTSKSSFAGFRGRLKEVVVTVFTATGLRLHLLGIHGDELAALNKVSALSRLEASADTGSHGIVYTRRWQTSYKCSELDDECVKKVIVGEAGRSLKPFMLGRPLV